MYSQYERVMDHRSFGERRDVFFGPQYADPYVRILPQFKVSKNATMKFPFLNHICLLFAGWNG